MSIWSEIFEGFTEGVLTAAAYQQVLSNGTRQRGRVDSLCRQLGWSVDERDASVIYLHFNDRGAPAGIRKIRIDDGDERLVTFSTQSFAVIPARNVAAEVLAYLLRRNISSSGIGNWGMYVLDDDRVMFNIIYQALGNSLDAEAFKFICQSLGSEAADFDDKLRQLGLLR